MIREIHNSAQSCSGKPHVVAQTLKQAALIFKKCMLINEDEFLQVNNSNSALISYVGSLGTFVGAMTLAKNEPLRTNHIDLKQILMESCTVKNKKFAIVFVCRILRESEQSRVFTQKNPWVSSIIQSLREIPFGGNSDVQTIELEIQSTFKALKINLIEIKPNGLIDCMRQPLTSCTSAMRKEIDYLHKRQKLILPPTAITSL